MMTREQAYALRAQMEATYAAAVPNMTVQMLIHNRALCAKWEEGKHLVDEIRTVEGYPYKCRQEHDTAEHPDIVPGSTAWATFWIPFHGTSAETALPWLKPTCAEDMYKPGEYMIYTDGLLYRNKVATDHSPTDYPAGWEVQ